MQLKKPLWLVIVALIIFAIGFVAAPLGAIAQQNIVVDEVVGVVGDKIILLSDIELQVAQAKQQGVQGDDLPCQVMNQFLLENLMVNQAEIDSIVVSDEEVEAEITNRVRYFIELFGGDAEKMEDYYQKSISQIKEEFRPDIKKQLLAKRMQAKIIERVKVTPAEVKTFFATIPTDSLPYLNAEVEISQLIVKPKVTRQQKEAARQQLLDLRQRILSGEVDFNKMASIYSEDKGSGANGGDLGWTSRGQLVPPYEGAAFRLKPNEISDIVESEYGYHLIKLLERQGDRIHTQHILIKPKPSSTEEKIATAKLDSIRQLILIDTLSFEEAVAQFTEVEESKKSGGVIANSQTGTVSFEMNQLEPNLYFVIDTMKQGEISKSVDFELPDGTKAYRILYLNSRTKPHIANLKDDYARIQTVVENQKQQEATEKWFKRHVPATYVYINERYKSCANLQPWQNDFSINNKK